MYIQAIFFQKCYLRKMKKTMEFLYLGLYCTVILLFLGCAQPTAETGNVKVMRIEIPDSLPRFDLNYIMGKFDPAVHPDFTEIAPKYASAKGMYMRQDAFEAFKSMFEAAQKDGVNLKIVSAARNFDRQTQIWNNKWSGRTLVEGGVNLARDVVDPVERARRILRFSSMPGTSRHHWGTDIDLNALEDGWFLEGEGKRVYEWLNTNADDFGYCQTYTVKNADRPNGYEEEKWHWTYTPVSRLILQSARLILANHNLNGFEGCEVASELGILENYVLGINPSCD